MSANRPRDTKPELTLRKALYHSGHRGYRINYRIPLQEPARSKGTKGGNPTGRKGASSNPRSEIPNPKSHVRPDITFVGKKIAIFVHGCYWHRCPMCNYPLPKNNTEFWQAKFDRNTARDRQKRLALLRHGWKVITVWECDLKNANSSSHSDA